MGRFLELGLKFSSSSKLTSLFGVVSMGRFLELGLKLMEIRTVRRSGDIAVSMGRFLE